MVYAVHTRLLSILISSWLAITGLIQDGSIRFIDASQSYTFGTSLVFKVIVQSEQPINEIYIFIKPDGKETRVEKVSTSASGEVVYPYDIQNNPIRPFSAVDYWYQAITNEGISAESEHFTFLYEDNRFAWQQLKDELFTVRWTDGDLTFGQKVLNTAHDGLKSAQSYLPVELNPPIDIFVYPTYEDLQVALKFTNHQQAAGHASPLSNLILVSAPTSPDQFLELERQIPHELTHILQYQLTGSGYTRIPMWLIEGNASLAEIFTNPDYQRVLTRAADEQTLIPMASLCRNSFQGETSEIFQSYAQSESFTRYLFTRFGATGISEILKAYGDGLGCEEGAKKALGESLSELETGWLKETLGVNQTRYSFLNLVPYFALSLIVILPFGLFGFLRKKL